MEKPDIFHEIKDFGKSSQTSSGRQALIRHSELVSESWRFFRVPSRCCGETRHFSRNHRFRKKQSNEFSMTKVDCFVITFLAMTNKDNIRILTILMLFIFNFPYQYTEYSRHLKNAESFCISIFAINIVRIFLIFSNLEKISSICMRFFSYVWIYSSKYFIILNWFVRPKKRPVLSFQP